MWEFLSILWKTWLYSSLLVGFITIFGPFHADEEIGGPSERWWRRRMSKPMQRFVVFYACAPLGIVFIYIVAMVLFGGLDTWPDIF